MSPKLARRVAAGTVITLAAILATPLTSIGAGVALSRLASGSLAALAGAVDPAGSINYGSDGRFTILLIGSDYRKTLYGERTDVMMVMTIDSSTKRVSAASIPRDTVYFPRAASNGGGTSGTNRVNAMYSVYYRHNYAHAKVDVPALVRFKKDVGRALDTEIDYVAMVRFKGFVDIVNRIGGINVQIAAAIRDDFYRTRTSQHRKGVFFPVSGSWALQGNPVCKPYPKKCHSALAYARSRHGTVGNKYNNDFRRSLRQQSLAVAGAGKIVSRGQGQLSDLVSAAQGRVYTDLPRTLGAATQLYNLVNGAHLASNDQVVFAPSKWAYTDNQTPLYTFKLDLPKVRNWINHHFGS
ncbi:MAG: polyisoprenyl-teichoic acid--peptidoglycan teichoic acid transferase [Chloroflexota bacterium]|nr:polyisoprenyl-teichoic acid--peptidoglycan teichoic acid transferase [Chloroflexota bacterium]